MRTKDKKFSDYDLKKEDVNRIKNMCRNADHDGLVLIKIVAHKIYPEIGDQLYESLVNKMSYERLYAKDYVPIGQNSFYGYRKKLIHALYVLDQATR